MSLLSTRCALCNERPEDQVRSRVTGALVCYGCIRLCNSASAGRNRREHIEYVKAPAKVSAS